MHPPITIRPYSHLEALLGALSQEWQARPSEPVLTPVVVPSVAFTDYLSLYISQKYGVCMGFEFLTPQKFLSRALNQKENPWDKQHLCWHILSHIKTYAPHLGVENTTSRDRFAMANLLADQFENYGHIRPEIIHSWNQGEIYCIPKKTASEHEKSNEAWQRELWLELKKDIPVSHPALDFETLRYDPAFTKNLLLKFPKILLIGSGALDPLLVEALALFAEAGSEVQIHLVLPSLEYLGDLKSTKSLPDSDQDPETLAVTGRHPLLESMSRHAVGTFLLLGKLDEQYTHWPEANSPQPAATSLLTQLQSDIRAVRSPSAFPTSAPPDLSIRVHSCFGPRREMETLRDELLRAFQDIPDLKPDEVHIVTPSLEIYQPFVSAILQQGTPSLPVQLTELPIFEENTIIDTLLFFLELVQSGRFECSRLRELLQMPAVQEALDIIDDERNQERVLDWLMQSGLTQGLGESSTEPGTWQFSRDRLVAARWMGTDTSACYPDATFILPIADQLASDLDLRDRFLKWFSALETTCRTWQVETTPADWGTRLLDACKHLLDEKNLSKVLPHIATLQAAPSTETLDAGAIFDWLTVASNEAGKRGKLSGSMTFGRFKQLQNLPCRVLAMVGMQSDAFPGKNHSPAWDLLQIAPHAWDRNTRIDDRQLFLDAILSPTDRLIITAPTQNVRSGITEPFSPCVDELLRVTTQMGAIKDTLVVKHRLQPFCSDYYTAPSALPTSFDEKAKATVTELMEVATSGGSTQPFSGSAEKITPSTSTTSDLREISIAQLVAFWKEPAKAFMRVQGVRISQDAMEETALDRAPLSLDSLQAWNVKDAILKETLQPSPSLPQTQALLGANRGLPPADLGNQIWESNRKLSEPVGAAIQALHPAKIEVEVEVPDCKIRIVGKLKTTESKKLLSYRTGEFKKAKHYLEAWIQAVVAAASLPEPMPSLILDETNPSLGQELAPIAHEDAENILKDLIVGFLEGETAPLAYSPEASDVYAKNVDDPNAMNKVSADWNKEANFHSSAGEGHTAAAKLAWRDQEVFADPAPWIRWGDAIAKPLRTWAFTK